MPDIPVIDTDAAPQTDADLKALNWATQAFYVTKGSQFGAIIACALDIQRDALPRFSGKASVTSDGFVMCSFYTQDGDHKPGAFVGGFSDLKGNVDGLIRHLGFDAETAQTFRDLIQGWIGQDFSGRATLAA